MTDEVNEQIINVLTRLNVEDPSAGASYNQHIRGLFNWRGIYNDSLTYYYNDVVEYLGLIYIRISQTAGSQLPTDSSWNSIPLGQVNHDLQSVSSNTQTQSVSANNTYVDLDSMILTSKDLGSMGTYQICFSAIGYITSSNQTLSFRLLKNNTAIPNQENNLVQYQNERSTCNIVCIVDNVVSGDVFKIQWKRSNGTAFCLYRSLMINGIISEYVK